MADAPKRKRKHSLLDYFSSTKSNNPEPMEIDEEAKEQSPEKAEKVEAPEKVETEEVVEAPETVETEEVVAPETVEQKVEEPAKKELPKEPTPPPKDPAPAQKKPKTKKKPPKVKEKKNSPPKKSGIKKKKKNAFELLKKAAKKKSKAQQEHAVVSENTPEEKEDEAKANKISNGIIDYGRYNMKPLLDGKELRWALKPPTKPKAIKKGSGYFRRKEDPVYDQAEEVNFDLPVQPGYAGQLDDLDKKKVKELDLLDRLKLYRDSNQYARDSYHIAPLLGYDRDELGFDPRWSAQDTSLSAIGHVKKTPYTKQNMGLNWPNFGEARKKQYSEHVWDLWCDPSAQTQLHHPDAQQHKEGFECIVRGNPIGMNLKEQFGNKVEFLYISPPWDVTHWGNGVEGFFTLEHLKKLDIRFLMNQGFLYLWAPFSYFPDILEIMQEKGFDWADSCATCGVDLHMNVLNVQRNPFADKDDYAGRMCGIKFHGFLFKCYERNTEGNWVIGNQIQKDIKFSRLRTNPNTGQYRYDHSYVYELYQRIVAVHPKDGETVQALHLYCDDDLRHKNWKGVLYYEEPAWVKECGLEPDLTILDRELPLQNWQIAQRRAFGSDVDKMDIEEEEVESKV